MDPTLQQLVQYITQELSRGVSEQALRAGLLQQGWTREWVEAAFRTARPQTLPAPRTDTGSRDVIIEAKGRRARARLMLAIFAVVLLVVAVGAYVILTMMDSAAQQKVLRDQARRDDLAVMLSDLSDYYVAHSKYPLRDDLNDSAFLNKNGFVAGAIQDPQWAAQDTCAKDGKPVLTASPTTHCYVYAATTSQGTVCDNQTTPCTRMSFTILLEKEKQPYSVVFDQNTEVEEE